MYGSTSREGKDCNGAETAEPEVDAGGAAALDEGAKLVAATVARRPTAKARALALADRQPWRRDSP
jgi:hypothetical protein